MPMFAKRLEEKGKSNPSKTKQGKDSLTLSPTVGMQLSLPLFATVELVPPNDAKFLVENFDVILLPTFETSRMVSKSRRKLRNKSVRLPTLKKTQVFSLIHNVALATLGA
jgi:hypothetical protein